MATTQKPYSYRKGGSSAVKRALALIGSAFFLVACGPSEEAMRGYRQCMSDKRKAHSEESTTYVEECVKDMSFNYCTNTKPTFWQDTERDKCAKEYGIRSKIKI